PEIKADDRRWPLGHVDLHRGLGKSARQIAAPLHDVAPQSRIGGFGIELDRLVEIGQSFWQRPRIKIGKSTIEILTEIFWIEPDRLVEIRNGAIKVAFGQVSGAAVVESRVVFRVEPDRLVVIRDGAVVVVLVLVSEAAIIEGPGEVLTAPPARLDRRRA